MSERCSFYRTEFKISRANAQHPGAREYAPKRMSVPFCAHAASGLSEPLGAMRGTRDTMELR
ncbi:MAG: hypothetical protein U1D35_05415, partial [Paracoccaceae bacterium]|nr:hypothetical protein [Paracoccaceae bacterium]